MYKLIRTKATGGGEWTTDHKSFDDAARLVAWNLVDNALVASRGEAETFANGLALDAPATIKQYTYLIRKAGIESAMSS